MLLMDIATRMNICVCPCYKINSTNAYTHRALFSKSLFILCRAVFPKSMVISCTLDNQSTNLWRERRGGLWVRAAVTWHDNEQLLGPKSRKEKRAVVGKKNVCTSLPSQQLTTMHPTTNHESTSKQLLCGIVQL